MAMNGLSARGLCRCRVGRIQPASRADHAVRLLLSNMAAWENLSQEDHAMLCEQPVPHGEVFVWLDGQFHEHGALPWGVLREAIKGRDFELRVMRLMGSAPVDAGAQNQEATRELRALLDLMLADQLMQQETEALAAAATDPEALQRYRALQERRRTLTAVRMSE